MTHLKIRIDFTPGSWLGPGRVELLERIRDQGSIAAAGRDMGMSYRRAWMLVVSVNQLFRERLVETSPGGRQGGGAVITNFGRDVIRRYRAVERVASEAVTDHIAILEAALSPALQATVTATARHRRGPAAPVKRSSPRRATPRRGRSRDLPPHGS
ncbi:MAG: hypothetical protein NVS1B4_21760 [Gemmatimonadaceae bacterium]